MSEPEFRNAYDVEANPSKAFRVIQSLAADRDFWKERFQVETRARIEAASALASERAAHAETKRMWEQACAMGAMQEDRLAELAAENERLKQKLADHLRATSTVDAHETANVRDKPVVMGAVKEGLSRLVERAQAIVPEAYVNWHDAAKEALSDLEPAAPEVQQPAGVASKFGNMARAVFDKTRVPVGTKLYTRPSEQAVTEAGKGLLRIVEEIDGAMNHGTWRDENGLRFKDTPEWVAFYNTLKAATEAGR